MFTVFSRAKTSEARSRSILLQFAYAPIAVGLIAIALGSVVAIKESAAGDGNFWIAMSVSVGIFIAGLCILIHSLRQMENDVVAVDADEGP